ncbi:MAG TPA: bifunctional DNA-formamidopyrimidine glycosylase/DNA-(apurinic or apyrimidinic site) lyase [Pyrinomonadaceae bacterium]|nr:bifunctional DNA-formamidopyrimidine glycosylase/DNA-(apurinic or apyrimidinic site) lyase [Pyrinomonadaceae bacterium]HMP66446.1 bifunctional DNA-formamidopyrimidine glycosylase/DNA-(apurinic or apyrimidinic site) lyase [Pyrinomonadaceae bacterium]
MPELPEVQLVASHLDELLSGRTIEAARLLRSRLAPLNSPEEFAELLAGSTISRVGRRGKLILIELDSGRTLMVHLRMSGHFMFRSFDVEDPKFTHAVLYFSDNDRLLFTDQRHFGYMRVVDTSKIHLTPEIAKLAPEPFSQEFSGEYLIAVLRRSRRPVKELLLDQTKVCGLGNIYASEALFEAGIRPQTRSFRVSSKKAHKLFLSIRLVLSESIELSRSVMPDRGNIGRGFYGEQSEASWRVYGREGSPCTLCHVEIKRLKQGGRSTFYCPRCQR